MSAVTEKFPVCFWNEIERDHAEVRRLVEEGSVRVGYALLLDEGGYWRQRRRQPPFGAWELWDEDAGQQMAPALLVERIP